MYNRYLIRKKKKRIETDITNTNINNIGIIIIIPIMDLWIHNPLLFKLHYASHL